MLAFSLLFIEMMIFESLIPDYTVNASIMAVKRKRLRRTAPNPV